MIPNQETSRRLANQALTGKDSLITSFCRSAVYSVFSKIQQGRLDVVLPDGSRRTFGESDSSFRGTIRIQSPAFFRQVAMGADIGFGEAYVDKSWETDDLTAVLAVLARNQDHMNERGMAASWIKQRLDRFAHLLRRNSPSGSKANISYHYDLSNPFYELMLDPTMCYSCAIFESGNDSLEQGQRNKLAKMIEKADVRADHHVLEIGSGWGALAIQLAKETGCRVTTVSLSEKQLSIVRQRVKDEGLEDRVFPQFKDYRHVEGSFDRIVSVEMLEAVGEQYLGTFFEQCDRLLKPDGVAVVQVITMAEHRFENYRHQVDWIQKYIFPGCLVPSVAILSEKIARHSRFTIHDLENIGIHYARTLREWRQRCHRHRTEMFALGFDEHFMRMWDYYLCYCEAGFAERILGTHQFVLTRPGNRSLPEYQTY